MPLLLPWLAFAFWTSLLLTAVVTIAVASGQAARIDARALAAFIRLLPTPDGKPHRLATAARDITALGGDALRLLFLVVCVIALGCDGRWRDAGALLAVSLLARAALFGLKRIVRRGRPPIAGETLSTFTSSFPSGHSFMAVVVYGAAALLIATPPFQGIAIGLALALGLAIGLTRLGFGIHWPSDVAAGWLAAIAWTSGCVWVLVRAGMIG